MEEPGTNRGTGYIDHRGGLVYQQEHGYKLITLAVWLRTSDEQSFVISRDDKYEFMEEVDHIKSGPSFVSPYPQLAAIDVYHFSVADEAEIELTIKGPSGERKGYYRVHASGVEENSPSFQLDIVRSSDSLGVHHIQTSQEQNIPSRFEKLPTYPQEINHTLPGTHEIGLDR